MTTSPVGFNRTTGRFETVAASPGPLRHISTWTYSTGGVGNVDFTSLDGADYLRIIVENATPTGLGFLQVVLSSDGGSTFGTPYGIGTGSTSAAWGEVEIIGVAAATAARFVLPTATLTPIGTDSAVSRNALRVQWAFSRTFTSGSIHVFGC